MAKDPAINWYFDNWAGGTFGMSRFHKGCYMDLLSAQYHIGHLSLDKIKTILGNDFSAWQILKEKFEQDANKNFFNERLAAEVRKREKYSESRSSNRKRTHEKDMNNISKTHDSIYNETETENEIKDMGVQGEKELTQLDIGNTVEFIHRVRQVKLSHDEVKNYWQAFLLNGAEPSYYSQDKKIKHFRNWVKKEIQNGSTINSGGVKAGTSKARTEALRNWGK